MPSSRRGLSRNQNPNLPRIKPDSVSIYGGGQEDGEGAPLATLTVQPKHAHLPEIGVDSNVIFEGLIFVYSVMSLCLQYINLYKTVWWLPHSNAKYALSFYLIDPYLSMFLVIVMSRRVIYCFVQEVYSRKSRKSVLYWGVQIVKFFLTFNTVVAFLYTAYRVVLRHSLLYSLFLGYPLITYVILFGHNVRPLFGKTILLNSLDTRTMASTGTSTSQPTTPPPVQTHASPAPSVAADKSAPGTPKHRTRDVSPIPYHVRDIPTHNCTMSPEAVREEVEILKTDFNNRIKQVLFNSMLCAYYVGFVPLCFAQNTLYYDTWWVGQHVCLVWISAFAMFMVHFLPAKYINVLHQCALHLGRWGKVEGRHSHKPYSAWSELQVWPQGALVKHVRGLFKAEGFNNSAEPGNSMHSRFYFMFHEPLRVTNWQLVITALLVTYQFILLLQATEWSHVVSLALLQFCNYYVLFKLVRDRFVLSRAYREERSYLQQ